MFVEFYFELLIVYSLTSIGGVLSNRKLKIGLYTYNDDLQHDSKKNVKALNDGDGVVYCFYK